MKKQQFLMKKAGVFDEKNRVFHEKNVGFLMKKAGVFDDKNGGF